MVELQPMKNLMSLHTLSEKCYSFLYDPNHDTNMPLEEQMPQGQ